MIKDRVIEFRRVRAGDLVPHPDNWREHPKEQRQAYASILEDIGFAGAILTRLMDDGRLQIIDGHMRSDYSPDIELPCVVTDLTADEADKALVSFDPLAMMARTNADKLETLHARIHTDHEGLRETLARMAADSNVIEPDENMWGDALSGLASGDRSPFQQMTFTLHDDQVNVVKQAINQSKSLGDFVDTQNENSNGNAIARICEMFLGIEIYG